MDTKQLPPEKRRVVLKELSREQFSEERGFDQDDRDFPEMYEEYLAEYDALVDEQERARRVKLVDAWTAPRTIVLRGLDLSDSWGESEDKRERLTVPEAELLRELVAQVEWADGRPVTKRPVALRDGETSYYSPVCEWSSAHRLAWYGETKRGLEGLRKKLKRLKSIRTQTRYPTLEFLCLIRIDDESNAAAPDV